MTTDISSEGLIAIYEALGRKPTARTKGGSENQYRRRS